MTIQGTAFLIEFSCLKFVSNLEKCGALLSFSNGQDSDAKCVLHSQKSYLRAKCKSLGAMKRSCTVHARSRRGAKPKLSLILLSAKSTERNCGFLEKAHEICLEWAKTHRATFAPKKYELVHLTRRPKRVNLAATIRIDQVTITPGAAIRVLGLWIDTKLRWSPHLAKTQAKLLLVNQVRALKCLSALTWGVTLRKAREVYRAVIVPVMTFAAPIWHEPKGAGRSTEILIIKLMTTQNECLRSVLGAYPIVWQGVRFRGSALLSALQPPKSWRVHSSLSSTNTTPSPIIMPRNKVSDNLDVETFQHCLTSIHLV